MKSLDDIHTDHNAPRTDLNIGNIFQFDFDFPFISDKNLATAFQSYFTSFVRSGSPNTYRETDSFPATIDMVPATVGTYVKMTDVGLLAFSTIDGPDTRKDRCDFWESGVWTGR
jgi:hypothetical protein